MKKWHFADKSARELLGNDPMQHFQSAVCVKSNPLREVWKTQDFFFKFDKRSGHGFRKEFSRACALKKRGIPLVNHLAYGKSEMGSCLITQALNDSVTISEFLEKKRPDDKFFNALIDFLKLMEYRQIIHSDLHCGNVLYVEKDNFFCLVDVRDARPARWFERLFYSSTPLHELIVELRVNLSTRKLCELLRKMDISQPEAFIDRVLEQKTRMFTRTWERRRQQVLSGYPKFTRCEGELLVTMGVQLSELEHAEKIPGSAGLFAGAFYLDLVCIPHRRVLAWSEKENILWLEPVSGEEADSATVADLRSRALKSGIDSSCGDWVYDKSGLVKLIRWKEM